MIIPDKKKAVNVILGSMGGEMQDVKPESGINEVEQTKVNIGNDMLHAIKINSGKAMAEAMEAFVELMSQGEPSQDGHNAKPF